MKKELDYQKTVDASQMPPAHITKRRPHYFPGKPVPGGVKQNGPYSPQEGRPVPGGAAPGNKYPSPENQPDPDWDDRDGYEIDDSYPQEKHSRAPMVIAIVSAVVIALAAAGFFGYMFFFYNDGSKKTTPTAPSTTAPLTTEEQTTQAMTENAVARLVTMPDIEGLTESEAYKALNEAGVKFKITREYSDTVPLNHVISQTPKAGKELSHSDDATVTLSKGKENEIIETTTLPKKETSTDTTDTTESTDPDETDETEATKASSKTGSDEFLLPDSASRNLSKSELTSLSHEDLNLALNEIFARHGRIFSDPSIKAYFNAQSWYHGTVSADDFDMSVLNEYELYNINLISEYQTELGYR